MKAMTILKLVSIPAILAIAACGDTRGANPTIHLNQPGYINPQPTYPTPTPTGYATNLVVQSLLADIEIGSSTYEVDVDWNGMITRNEAGAWIVPNYDIEICKAGGSCVPFYRILDTSRGYAGTEGYVQVGGRVFRHNNVQSAVKVEFQDFSDGNGNGVGGLKLEIKNYKVGSTFEPGDTVRVRAFYGNSNGDWLTSASL